MNTIEFFEDIFEYHHHFNIKLAEYLLDFPEMENDKPAYWLSHMINAHQIWNSRILNLQSYGVHDMHSLEEIQIIDNENYKNTITILNRHDLDTGIAYSNSKGKQFENTIQQILYHVANHHAHHRGQIAAELRRQNMEPLVTDYIFYKR